MQSKIFRAIDISSLIQLSKKNKSSVNILFFSILLLPISLFAGPLITEILIFIIFLSSIYTVILEKKKIYFNKFDLLIISFFFLIVISSLLSDHKLISLKSSFLSIRFIILIYAIIFIIKKLDYFFKYFFIICFLSFILNIFAGFIQFVFANNFFLASEGYRFLHDAHITTGLFGEEKKLGSFLCRLLPLVVGSYLIVSKKKPKKKVVDIFIFFIFFFCLVLFTSERMAIVYGITTLLFIIFYSFKINKKIVTICSLLILFIPLLLFTFNFNKFKEDLNHSYEQIFPQDKLVFFSKQHQYFAITSLELFKKKPILGIGPNNYRRNCNEINSDFINKKYSFKENNIQNCSTHPHNIFFQLLSETGFIGIIYYVVFNILLFIEIFKFFFKKNYNRDSIFFILPVIYFLNPFFPSGNFFNNWYMCFGILGLPFYLYLVKIKKSV